MKVELFVLVRSVASTPPNQQPLEARMRGLSYGAVGLLIYRILVSNTHVIDDGFADKHISHFQKGMFSRSSSLKSISRPGTEVFTYPGEPDYFVRQWHSCLGGMMR